MNKMMPVSAVESCLAQGKDGELGVTGEGTLLENAAGMFKDQFTLFNTSLIYVKIFHVKLLVIEYVC